MTVFRTLLVTLALPVVLASQVTVAEAATVNCSAFKSQAAAQAAYRANPVGLANLDRDRDGIACENNRAPFDRRPVKLAAGTSSSAAQTTSGSTAAATQGAPAPPTTGDGSSQSSPSQDWTALSLTGVLLLGLMAASALITGGLKSHMRLLRQD
jgi:Excalibur calcium-binding domain